MNNAGEKRRDTYKLANDREVKPLLPGRFAIRRLANSDVKPLFFGRFAMRSKLATALTKDTQDTSNYEAGAIASVSVATSVSSARP